MRNNTKKIMCGKVQIGAGAPVSIQSMCNVKTTDIELVTGQIKELYLAGCDIVRVAIPDMEAANAIKIIKQQLKAETVDIPIVADIHFDYKLAIAAIENGADKIRINPGNIGGDDRVREVVKKAKEYGIPIRVGVNSGSLEKDILEREGGVTAKGLAESAERVVKLLESMDFCDMVVSIKSSDVGLNFEATKLLSERIDYPLHIGVTEAGTRRMGEIKSAAGIGALLLSGIGDTFRVSLTSAPINEVNFAKDLLKAIGLRKTGIELVSCPTCGRTNIDLEGIAGKVEKALRPLDAEFSKAGKSIKIAVMGCAVNGPGESREADIGVAGGNGKAVVFSKGVIVKTIPEAEIVPEITRLASLELQRQKGAEL